METPVLRLPTVERWRREIETAVSASRAGNLQTALDAGVSGHALVVKVLDVHPCLGKVAGRRLLTELGIDHGATVDSLPVDRIAAVRGHCRCGRG
jgi:hypothetical protein